MSTVIQNARVVRVARPRQALTELDPALIRHVGRLGRARIDDLTTDRVRIEPGRLDPAGLGLGRAGVGLILLEGVMARTVRVTRGSGMQLFSTWDFIQPQVEAEISRQETHWTALSEVGAILLDERFHDAAAAIPGFSLALLERAQTSEARAAAQIAILNSARLETKISSLLWFLAEHWGEVDERAATIDLELTQESLASLVGAHRPSVSVALARLREAGTVLRVEVGGRPCWRVRRTEGYDGGLLG